MRRLIPFITIIFILLPYTLVHGSDEVYPKNQLPERLNPQEVSLVLDGVELSLSTPFLPSERIIVSEPDDPIQVSNIVQHKPTFHSLTVTAIPFGAGNSAENLRTVKPGNVAFYLESLREIRRTQGGTPKPGPTATIFGQEATGIMSTVIITLDVFKPRPVRIVEWMVEAGNRLWIIRISQEIQKIEYISQPSSSDVAVSQLGGIRLSAKNLSAPSTSARTRERLDTEVTVPSAAAEDDLPFPHWWDGYCDLNTYLEQTGDPSYPLGGEYRGVKACGPRPYYDNADHAITQFNPGWWGVLEWECVELSMRFLYLAYGVQTYQANGNQVVTNYSGDKLIKVNDGTPGIAPQPGDVLSLGPDTPVGHTSVVTSSNVDQQGNGTISVIEQNSSATGERTYTVSNWEVLSSYTVIGWLHDPNNGDLTPPTGDILEPLGNQTFQTNTIHLEGWASDEGSGLSSAQFTANYEDGWNDIGPGFSTIMFTYDWEWCLDDIPDGPISLALRLIDNQGNQNSDMPGLRHLVKKYTCPSIPKCIPSLDQIALFTEPNYGGSCQILNIGNYPDSSYFPNVGNDQAESILVGGNVMATIYTEAGYQDRQETIPTNDANLLENLTRSNSLSAIKVIDRDSIPSTPSQQWPENLSTYPNTESLTLFWNDGGGANLMRASIDGPSISTTSSWDSVNTRSLGSLTPGIYSWRVQARNNSGDSAWSPWHFFTISDATPSAPPSFTAPYSDTLEGDTSAWLSTGLWHLTDNDSHSSNNSWWYSQSVTHTYNTNAHNFGSLTTPKIALPSVSIPYYLEFWSKYETESPGSHWDQRRIQISLDSNEFEDIYQLKDDPNGGWLKIRLDLSGYYTPEADHDLQVRFYFTTVDANLNDYLGWHIDDVQISAQSPQVCSDPYEANDSPTGATPITYTDSISAEICPGFDRDYYHFSGSAGDQIVVDIDAKSSGSPLDSIVHLLDEDGSSTLSVHDDEVTGIRQDPHLGYRLPRDGDYFLSVRAWDTPMGTGPYTLTLFTDSVDPSISSLNLDSGIFLPAAEINIEATVHDALSGISHVQFLGFADGWNVIGDDWDDSGGWQTSFDTRGLAEGDKIDFYARTYDWAGNWAGIPAWDLTLDFTPPDTSADSLPSPNQSTAIHLNWAHTDNLAGIRSSHIRYRANGDDWLNHGFEEDTREWWYVGEAGNNYTFRIRAIDNAGNIEPYLDGAELTTSIPTITTLCSSPDAWDISPSINDNSPVAATPLPITWQSHNFCNPLVADWLFDADWFSLNSVSDHLYTISALPYHESTAVVIRLYDSDGITLITERSTNEFGDTSTLHWKATQDGTVYIELSHKDRRVAGNAVAYQVSYQDSLNGSIINFPMVHK